MPELTLNDGQRHAFARHLDGVDVAQLMQREPSPNPGARRGAPQLLARRGRLPVPARGCSPVSMPMFNG